MGYFFILLTVLFTVYGQLIIKYEVNSVPNVPSGPALAGFLVEFVLFRPLVISGLLSAVLASFAWIATLSRFELSYAYPFMSLNFVVVVLLSFVLFHEGINAYKLAGLALICLGVLVVSKGSGTAQTPRQDVSTPIISSPVASGGGDDAVGGAPSRPPHVW